MWDGSKLAAVEVPVEEGKDSHAQRQPLGDACQGCY